MKAIPENLATLHAGEEELWAKAVKIIENDSDLSAHVDLIERVMDLIQFFETHRSAQPFLQDQLTWSTPGQE